MSVGTSGKDLLDTVVTQQDSDEKGDAATVTKEDFTLHLWKGFWKQIQNHLQKRTAKKHKEPCLIDQT